MERNENRTPVANPNCHDYIDTDKFYMSDESNEIFAQWVEQGKIYGSEDDVQEYDQELSELIDPDLFVCLSEPYSPTFTAADNPGNEYRCSSLKHNQ